MDLKEIIKNQSTLEIILILAILIAAYFVGRLARKILTKISTKAHLDTRPFTRAFILSIARSATIFLIAGSVLVGKEFFFIPEVAQPIIDQISRLLTTLAIGTWVFYLVEIPGIWFDTLTGKDKETGASQMLSPILKRTLQVVVIGMVLAQAFTIISNKPITPIIASLGIAGVAVALAAQDTFKNFFGSFVLAGDKPFEIGERVVVDGYDGPIESIGLRSTRIRTLEGHLVTIPNGELANRTIQNVGKRDYIRRRGTISVTYDTPAEKIEEALAIIRELLDNHEGMHPDFPPRVFFKDLSAYSLDILFIYWYHPPDYWTYMEFSEKFNLELIRKFNAAGIDFAFPSQTIYMGNEGNEPTP